VKRTYGSPENAIRTDKHYRDMVHRLYRLMPGAPRAPSDEEGNVLWGEVEHTEQYAFCEQVAFEIVAAAQAYAR
jgi:hypothetical protein